MSQGFTQNLSVGRVIQIVNTQTGAVASGTTAIPIDDTVPQNTEGDQYMTLAITPTNASNKLLIQVVICCDSNAGGSGAVALFQDSTAGALAAALIKDDNAGQTMVTLNHYMTAGTTSATTFKVRAGTTAGTFTFNGTGGGTRVFGGVMASSITITEIKA